MKDLLKQIESAEQDMNRAQEQAEYWLSEDHYNEEKSEECEQEGDRI